MGIYTTKGGDIKEDGGKLWEAMNMFMSVVVALVSERPPYAQIHQVLQIKYVKVFMCPLSHHILCVFPRTRLI